MRIVPPVTILGLHTDCLRALHDVLCLECPKSGHVFVSCCKTTRSLLDRPALIGVKAPWTRGGWILARCVADHVRNFHTQRTWFRTSAVFVDMTTEEIEAFRLSTLPTLKAGIALGKNSELVKGTRMLLVAPPNTPIAFRPSGGLLRYHDPDTYILHFHRFQLRFESTLFVNNDAKPHRDNNDYDRWVEVRLSRLTSMSHCEQSPLPPG